MTLQAASELEREELLFAQEGRHGTGPSLIGFKPGAYEKNAFIRDLQPNDVILFIAADGTRGKRSEFIHRIKSGALRGPSSRPIRTTRGRR